MARPDAGQGRLAHDRLEMAHRIVILGGAAGVLSSWDERRVPFDLLVTIPLHGGAPFVGRSPGLGDIITVGEFYERAAGAQIVFT